MSSFRKKLVKPVVKYRRSRDRMPVLRPLPLPLAGLTDRLHTRKLKLATLNARSIRNKSAVLADVLPCHDLDVFPLTESWHEKDDDLAVQLVRPMATEVSMLRVLAVQLDYGNSVVVVLSFCRHIALWF